jgi:hypothetical protein
VNHAVSTELSHSSMGTALFNQLSIDEGLTQTERRGWHTSVTDARVVMPELLFHDHGISYDEAVFRTGDLLIRSTISGGEVQCVATAARRVTAEDWQALRELIPAEPEPAQDVIELTFWMHSDRGPQSITRRIETPSWDEICGNYTSDVQRHISPLMGEFRPTSGGQLLLWHGVPGTVKTYAIRALLREWKSWCLPSYITDPEEFFGRSAYMLKVLLGFDQYDDDEKWRLLILEDAGELMSSDARQRTGQGLSRLLNVTDGLIGQGLRVIVLITTNEELGHLHPAVTRPGRCASEVGFKPLSEIEAAEWMRSRGDQRVAASSATIAELFAQLESDRRLKSSQRQKVGF